MASIQEKIRDGKIVSFKFKACLGRDESGKQVFKCTTWYPPAGLTKAKIKKEAARAADIWEAEIRQSYIQERNDKAAAEKIYTFGRFVKEVWLPLCVQDGSHRPSTVAMYTNILKVILPHFESVPLQEITSIQITQYLRWLRNDYRTPHNKPLAEKSIKHHYNILALIFGYAERQDMIEKNPMKKVDTPKVTKKAVDALSEEDAARFFTALDGCTLEFRCLLQLLITTGLRRGECIGLQWQDVDFEKATISVNRAVTYTPDSGIMVAAPKTATSIRTIPLMQSTLSILTRWQREQKRRHPNKDLTSAFLFSRENAPFEARDPSAITRHLKRFTRAAGLPDVSPHDLRHTCASLLLSSGADIKSVQEILGHADASTTLNFYVKTDLRQMRVATEKYAMAFGL